MSRIITLLLLSISGGLTAQIHHSTNNGNFFNPFNWDCLCVPASGDSLVVNHSMQLTASIYYNAGQIKITSSGSLMEDGSNRDVWIDGTGSLINLGTFDCYRLYVSQGSFNNAGTTVYFDSLLNQGTIINSGTMTVYDILNDQAGTFTNSGAFTIENNFNNQGLFTNGHYLSVGNDFSNCNIQSMDAMFVNDGIFCIDQDFTNCLDDTLTGTGSYFVGGSSSNFGVFDGNFSFNTSTGTLGVNTGTVDPGVSFGTAHCNLSVEEELADISVYPNPARDILFVSTPNLTYQIMDVTGKIVLAGTTSASGIEVSTLNAGVYTLVVVNSNGNKVQQKFIKE